ncbi:MAG: hypothetical protein JNJ99_02845, partial [Crocinitomicaceae bacterium]|nr:hypothetical protein [Crocinitomicaceae bacterium]
MLKPVIKNPVKILFTGLFLITLLTGNAQMSYEEYHKKYIPHYETIAPDLEVVKITNESDVETGNL